MAADVGVEFGHSAIVDGKAQLLITKIWGSVDLSHKGSLAKTGMVAIPDGELVLEFPVENESMTLSELKKLMEGVMDSFSGSWDAFVEFVDGTDF